MIIIGFVIGTVFGIWFSLKYTRQIARIRKRCPVCWDCSDGCPIYTPNDPKNKWTRA